MKICNIGSLNLDYVYQVDHFVQPGETLQSGRRSVFPGGKGLNQSIALARAGASVLHAGRIGPEGESLRALLKEAGADTRLVETVEIPTGHAVIQVTPSGENCILLFGGANQSLTSSYLDTVFQSCEEGDLLLLQNETNLLNEILTRAKEKNISVALNPSPFDDSLKDLPLEAVRWFLINEIEGKALTGKESPEEIGASLRQAYPSCAVVLTLGSRGVYYEDEKTALRVPSVPVQAVDTTAAGDTFTGYFLASLCAGLSSEQALRRACLAASIAVTRPGAAPSIPWLAEVQKQEKEGF